MYFYRITCLWLALGVSVIRNQNLTTQGVTSRQTCVLPPTPGHLYFLHINRNTNLPPGSDVDLWTVVDVNCEQGYYNYIQHDYTMQCLQAGNWSYIFPNLCIRISVINNRNTTTPQETTSKKTCVLPAALGYLYSLQSMPNTILPLGSDVDVSTVVQVNCENGYYNNIQQDVTMVCLQTGNWSQVYSNLCKKKCPPVISDNLDISCTFNGDRIDCTEEPSVPGTKLIPKCKPAYSLLNGRRPSPVQLQCNGDGTWTGGELFRCQPMCGQVYTKSKTLIANGKESNYGSAPWNVGIYYKPNGTGVYDVICGGTLISPNLVISAAHCFWDDELREKIITNLGQYKIAVGKYARDFEIKDNEFTAFFGVRTYTPGKLRVYTNFGRKLVRHAQLKAVHLRDTYNGIHRFFDEDLAVVVLQRNVTFSPVVGPVCVDWDKKYTAFLNGYSGKVVGWGDTEDNVRSPILLELQLPYINRSQCQSMFSIDFQRYLTSDKFCAGAVSGLGGVLSGDSGAGLTIAYGNTHYFTGIVSSKDPTTNNSVAIFTDVRFHIEWITQLYLNYNAD